jgi:hypothetical protein
MPRVGCGARRRQVCRRLGGRYVVVYSALQQALRGDPIRACDPEQCFTQTRVRMRIDRNYVPTLQIAIHAAIQAAAHTAIQVALRKPLQDLISAKVRKPGASNIPSKFKGTGGAAVWCLQRQQSAEDVTNQAAGNNQERTEDASRVARVSLLGRRPARGRELLDSALG